MSPDISRAAEYAADRAQYEAEPRYWDYAAAYPAAAAHQEQKALEALTAPTTKDENS